jgi:phosphate transport system substrate-binding protein
VRSLEPNLVSFGAAGGVGRSKGAKNYAVDLIDTAGAKAWPIVSATFILLPQEPKDAGRSAAVMKFFDWAYTNGGAIAGELEYIALPRSVQDAVRASWKSDIKG